MNDEPKDFSQELEEFSMGQHFAMAQNFLHVYPFQQCSHCGAIVDGVHYCGAPWQKRPDHIADWQPPPSLVEITAMQTVVDAARDVADASIFDVFREREAYPSGYFVVGPDPIRRLRLALTALKSPSVVPVESSEENE